MRIARFILVSVCAATLLTGCSTLKKFTGQRNDTVLPGTREEILPPDQQVNPKPGNKDVLNGEPAQCDPAVDDRCAGKAVDQEAPGTLQ
jgi:hypothetical protein